MSLDRLAATIDAELHRVRAPGCSIAVVDDQGVLESRGFGHADLRTGRSATPETLYHLFSVTKLFTATRIMQLVETGALSLDTRITEIVPTASAEVTLEHLLSHTSGLRDTLRAFLAFHVDPERRPSTSDALSKFSLKRRGQPGRKVSYENVNYMLLGAAIEQATGQPYEAELMEHVLAPIGMTGTLRMLDPAAAEHAATGYLPRFDPTGLLFRVFVPRVGAIMGRRIDGYVELEPYDLDCAPIGGLVTSVQDAAKFVQDQLAAESQLLSSRSRDRMRQLVGRGKAGIVSAVGTGLGWKIGDSPHGRYLNHEGGGPGFTAELRIYPERNLGMVLVMTRMAMACGRAAHRICESIAAQQHRLS